MSERLSGTVTFLFTDIEGSTVLLKRLGRERYGELLARQQVLLRESFAANRGEEVDTQGDQSFVAFRSASDALAAAIAIHRTLADQDWPDGVELRVRIGIHTGEASAAGEGYVGFSVHRAARIGAVAHGGQTLVSSATRELVEDDLPEGVVLRDLGSYRLKDIDRPERISQVVAEGLRTDFPPLRGATRVEKRQVLRRRSLLAAALAGVVAAAVAVSVFALRSGGSGSTVATARIGADSVGAVDASSGRLLASSPVESTPGALAADRGSVWVANPGSNSVSRIDAKSHAKTQTIAVGNDPTAIAIGGGFVWVANGLSGTVSKIDPNANGGGGAVVDTIPVGNGPSGVAFIDGRLWVANSTDRTVLEFVAGSHTPLRTIGVAGGADALATGLGFVWVASSAANSVTRIVVRSGTVLSAIGVGNGPTAIAVGDGAAWVANSLDGTLSRIDPSDGAVSVIPVGGIPTGVAAGGGLVWVSDGRGGTISRVDPAAKTVAKTVRTGNQPQELALSGRALYVAVKALGVAHRGGTLAVFPIDPTGFDSIDPARDFTQDGWSALSVTNDGLVTFQRVGGSAGTRLVPDLATSIPVPTDGGRTYTFQVRTGIRYSTGALVEPADFRRAIERSLSASYRSHVGAGYIYAGIVGASSCAKKTGRCDLSKGIMVDPSAATVTFHLSAPDPVFLDKLTEPPAYAVPADTPLVARLPLPATGPYLIKKYEAKHGAVLARNPRFHEWSSAAQPAGYPDEITWTFGASSADQVAAVRAGTADYTPIAAGQAPALRRSGYGNELHVNPTFETDYFFFNTRLAPFDDVRVRRAVNLAVDRNHLITLTLGPGSGQPTCQVLPPNLAGYIRYCPYTPDLVRARRLVAASGTTDLTVTVWSFPGRARGAAYLRSVLRSLGYKTRLKVLEIDAYFKAANDPRNRIQVGSAGWIADQPSADNFFYPLLTCPSYRPRSNTYSNYGLFCSTPVDREITRARTLEISDPQAAGALWSKIDQDVVDLAAWVAYANAQTFDLVSSRVGNYQHNPWWGALLDQMWVR